jgi:hypothetical protein
MIPDVSDLTHCSFQFTGSSSSPGSPWEVTRQGLCHRPRIESLKKMLLVFPTQSTGCGKQVLEIAPGFQHGCHRLQAMGAVMEHITRCGTASVGKCSHHLIHQITQDPNVYSNAMCKDVYSLYSFLEQLQIIPKNQQEGRCNSGMPVNPPSGSQHCGSVSPAPSLRAQDFWLPCSPTHAQPCRAGGPSSPPSPNAGGLLGWGRKMSSAGQD